ncbi:MAG: hypothetical protein WAU68_05385 [Vitreimonas sp.]
MSDPTPPINPLEKRRRVEYAPMAMPFTGGGQQGKTLLFVAIVFVCAGVSAYMYFVQHMPLTDMRVIGPAMGALWFVLRLFMTLTPRT